MRLILLQSFSEVHLIDLRFILCYDFMRNVKLELEWFSKYWYPQCFQGVLLVLLVKCKVSGIVIDSRPGSYLAWIISNSWWRPLNMDWFSRTDRSLKLGRGKGIFNQKFDCRVEFHYENDLKCGFCKKNF